MGLIDHKFRELDFVGKDISSLPDAPSANGITAAELKARFDQIPKMMLALGNFNNLIDALMLSENGQGGAQDIGIAHIEGLDAKTVQKALEALKNGVDTAQENIVTDETLIYKDGKLSVNTADDINDNNTLPVTAAAVYETVGNIEILLKRV